MGIPGRGAFFEPGGAIDVSNTSVDHAVIIDPLLAEREFALVPLCEIMRQRRHPVTGATVGEMLDALRNK